MFVCRYSTFDYINMTIGLKNTPTHFHRAIKFTLENLIDVCVLVYFDDTLFFIQWLVKWIAHIFSFWNARIILVLCKIYQIWVFLTKSWVFLSLDISRWCFGHTKYGWCHCRVANTYIYTWWLVFFKSVYLLSLFY